MSDNYAVDAAARFGEIPFVEFTTELISGVFNGLVEQHVQQMQAYGDLVQVLSQSISAYINNTQGNVTFEEIADFVSHYTLPEPATGSEAHPVEALDPADGSQVPADTDINNNGPWWATLIGALRPAAQALIGSLTGSGSAATTTALTAVTTGTPTYANIHNAIASLICANKYSMLQMMVRQGMLRLVVTEGEIETRVTFSTWETSETRTETESTTRTTNSAAALSGILGFSARRNRQRMVTVNTAKSYQRDTSGTRVDIFGRVLIRFKTDYSPLR
ncbi:MAG: hypothetical protein IPK80_03945 [Nannocystis sp.]|nr:hypothetical protein [Nannocystis sp.]